MGAAKISRKIAAGGVYQLRKERQMREKEIQEDAPLDAQYDPRNK
jgi:hypothetical protein